MIKFDIITIFPDMFTAYFNESILKRAREKKLINIKVWNLRDFTKDKHKKTDNKPFGGGPGMILKIEPLANCLKKIVGNHPLTPSLRRRGKGEVVAILLSVSGKQFNSEIAMQYAKQYKHIILICGRYEGIDERIKQIVKAYGIRLTALSIGPYVLTGGELPAMVILDAVSRHISGVLGKAESLEEKRYGVGVPVYTRPEIFKFKNKKYAAPKILLSGDHKKIEEWRLKHKK